MKTIGFIGLGLIGGSVARTIRKFHPDYHLLAFDTDREALAEAVSSNIIDGVCDIEDERFRSCDYIFLCAPVEFNVEYMEKMKDSLGENFILTDVGSVKSIIHEKVTELGLDSRFIGGHPMAGSEQSGYTSAHADLLCGAKYVITPSAHTSKEHLDSYVELVKDIKAVPIVMDPATHDYCAAAISHVPHLVSAALAKLVKDADTGDYKDYMHLLAAGGFKDTTRIAASSPEMWEQICAANPTAISQLLGEYINSLTAVKEHIDSGDSHYIYKLFEEAGIYRNTFFGPDRS